MADAAAEMEEGGMVRTFKDLFAGAAGGIAQVLLGESHGSWLHLSGSFKLPSCLSSRVQRKAGGQQVFFSFRFTISPHCSQRMHLEFLSRDR